MGRLQTFDEDMVIQQAQELFWKKGYAGTSLSDILEATGLHKGSLYRVFESKEKLFLLALQKYAAVSRTKFIRNQNPLSYLQSFFETMIKECKVNSKGCFIMNTCVEVGTKKGLLSKVANSLFEEVTRNFQVALVMARDNGEISSELNLDELAKRFVAAAFAIREMSKFIKDEATFRVIANGVLKEINATI